MKPIKQIFRYFYSTETKTTRNQLREDFGDFLAKPIGEAGPTGEFTIVRVRGIGEHIHFALIMKRLVEGSGDLNSLSPSLRSHMPDQLANLRDLSEITGIGKPLLHGIAFIVAFLQSSLKLIRASPQGTNSLGYFAPIRRGECEIVIKVGQVSKKGLDAGSMISHEHIHMLQYKSEPTVTHSRSVSWTDDQFLTQEARASKILPYIKYIFERNEVEARLHDLVVSFYRKHRNLPQTVPSFLALLAASSEIGRLVTETLADENVEFDPVLGEYNERDKTQAMDLNIALLSMPENMAIKFIIEVLPVMYGNLLHYYGNDGESQAFISQVSRPNFYDQLYALSTPSPVECEPLSSEAFG